MKNRPGRTGIGGMVDDALIQLRRMTDGKHALQRNGLWEAYAKLEHAILLLKLENDFETPAGFELTKFGKKNEAELLQFAIDYLEKGRRGLGGGSTESVIANLRRCRDALKMLVLKS